MPHRVTRRPVKSGKNFAIEKLMSNNRRRIVGRSRTRKDAEASARKRDSYDERYR